MKRKEYSALAILVLVFGSLAVWAQGNLSIARGTIIEEPGKPAANLQVILTGNVSGRQFKTKTDLRGEYTIVGLGLTESYKLEVLSAKGDVLCTQKQLGAMGELTQRNLDLSHRDCDDTSDGAKAPPVKLTKEQQKAENAKLAQMNEFITQYQAAFQAQKWPEAEKALQQLVATDPNTTRWEFYQRLGDVQDRNNEQADALRSLDKGIEIAQAIVSGKASVDPHNPNPDPAKAKGGIGQMMVAEGNIYVKLGTPELATPLFSQATQDNPSPALAYYNLCAAEFNSNKLDAAVAACDRSLASDPSRAEAWFLKGSALYKIGKTDSGKVAVEALNKYLELDPNGQHANDAKSILQAVSQK